MFRPVSIAAPSVVLAALLSGCSGSQGTLSAPLKTIAPTTTPTTLATPASSPSATQSTDTTTRVIITIPAHSARATTRRPKYVSPSTQSITVQVDGGTPSVQNLGATSPDCSATGTNYPYTCTVPITATPGSHTFTFVTYDGSNAAGSVLSTNSVVQTIGADQINTIAVTLAGVPAAVQVDPAPGASGITGNQTGLNFIGRQTQTLTIVAVDADGNDIVGPGAPTLAVSVNGATAGSGIAIAATNGSGNEYVLTSSDPGTATLAVAASPAATAAGATMNVTVPLASLASATTLAGSSTTAGFTDGTGTTALFNGPAGVAYDPANGDTYVVDAGNCAIRQLTVAGVVTTIAGGGPSACAFADGSGTAARFNVPVNIAYDTANGDLYVADQVNCAVRQVTPSGAVSTLAGFAAQPCTTINGTGTAAQFDYPIGIAYDAANTNLYVTDTQGCTVRAVTSGGVVTTLAGGTCGFADGTGSAAEFMGPTSITYDASDGNLYVGDSDNCSIRKVTTAGVVTTLAGDGVNSCGYADGVGIAAAFMEGEPVAYSPIDNDLYVSDESNCLIRQVTTPGAVVTTVAGSVPVPSCGFANGLGTAAGLAHPAALTYDSANGNLIFADGGSNTIRMLQP